MKSDRSGPDGFLDLGVVSPDEIVSSAARARGSEGSEKTELELTFYVLQRVAMSANTFAELHAKSEQIFNSMIGREFLADAFIKRVKQTRSLGASTTCLPAVRAF